jgi:hypothetical protein
MSKQHILIYTQCGQHDQSFPWLPTILHTPLIFIS